MNPHSHRRSRGFTLTELLIVIAIIAVLAAIMFPLVRGMRERAHSAVCTQNLKQIGVGLLSYTAENSGRFPDGRADVSWYGGITTSRCWYDAAAENMGREYVIYHKGDPLPAEFGCPSGHGKAYEPAWPYTGDYAANSHLGNPNNQVLTISAVKQPSATPYVQDTVCQNNFGSWSFAKGESKQNWKNKTKSVDSSFADRHGGSGNILWVDGHVSSMRYSEYMDYATDPAHGGVYNFVRGNW